ncbi:MAG TPA: hypothetical protein PL183_10980 [Aquamicrobium sp.]|nr:hypothetical protein [Aquamicrobium sp.]
MLRSPRLPAKPLRGLALAMALAGQTGAALAACPMELAVYQEPESGATIDFYPGRTATVTNAFRMVFGNGLVLEGAVMWDAEAPRSLGLVTYGCPEGDATGAELAACTVWQGAVYSVDGEGRIDQMPPEGADAPQSLLFADLGRAVRQSAAYEAAGLTATPWDAFSLSGCQE